MLSLCAGITLRLTAFLTETLPVKLHIEISTFQYISVGVQDKERKHYSKSYRTHYVVM